MRWTLAAAVVTVCLLSGCGAATRGPEALRRTDRPTCLVLSVGGAAGIAHLGAVEALRAARVPVRCVVGTSMGAVVGALYAVDPSGDTTARYERFARSYERATRAAADSRGGGWGVVGALLGAATGGVGAVLLGAVGGYTAGASSVRQVDHQRFVRVLDLELGRATVEQLPVPFLTMHQERRGTGMEMIHDRAGPLAAAVGRSAANPFIFSDLDANTARQLDPGADRRAAVPVDAACEAHPGARLLVVNVTNDPARLMAGQSCEVVEVRVRVSPEDQRTAMMPGPGFRRVVDAGRTATSEALARYSAP